MKSILIILLSLLISVPSAWAKGCIVDGTEIELVGTVSRETFPGPPNYKSIENGDAEETYWVLTIEKPYSCADKFSYANDGLHRIDGTFNRFQLGMNRELYEDKKLLLNKVVSIKGEVWSGHTGHHNTEMLIDVKSMEPVNSICPIDAYSQNWDVDPLALYTFTSQVVGAVRERNLIKLSEYIKGELKVGPRKRYLKNKNFSDVFTEDFRNAILTDGPTCYVFNYQGVMLGNGRIWIRYDNPTSFYIYSITDWIAEKYSTEELPIGWTVDGITLAPGCFFQEWSSSDNFEAFEERYSIKDREDFRTNTGKYLGTFSLAPFKPDSWGDQSEMISLISPAETCSADYPYPTVSDRLISHQGKYGIERYQILDQISVEDCQRLAPSFKAKCKVAYLVKVDKGDVGFNIYGLFQELSGRKVIAPLVNFDSENEARNYVEALKNMSEADILFTKGLMYATGQGLPKDENKAIEYYIMAAEKGHSIAQVELGIRYATGRGVPKNNDESDKWIKKAANQGNPKAQLIIGMKYKLGVAVPKDYSTALKYFIKAANQDLAVAQVEVGKMFFNGEGVERDHEEAMIWFSKAADSGNADAQQYMGAIYYLGFGAPTNYDKAIKLFIMAANQGNASAYNRIGVMYADGFAVTKSLTDAYCFYSVSATLKNEIANKNLQYIEKRMTPQQISEGQLKAKELWRKVKNKKYLTSLYLEHYTFGECYGKTAGGSSICYQYEVKIFFKDGNKNAEYNIDGWQTMKRYSCSSKEIDNVLHFYFETYGEEDLFKSERIKKGQLLFKIVEKNKKKYISHFQSPVDGELITKEYELRTLQN